MLSILTPKQNKVAELVAEGYKNREIAEKLGTTEMMVKNINKEIFDRCGVWSRLELALYWTKQHYLAPTPTDNFICHNA